VKSPTAPPPRAQCARRRTGWPTPGCRKLSGRNAEFRADEQLSRTLVHRSSCAAWRAGPPACSVSAHSPFATRGATTPRPDRSHERRTELLPRIAGAFAELGFRRTTTAELAER